MQIPIQKFRQVSIVFQKPGILSEKSKTLTSTNYHRIVFFFVEALHTPSTCQCLPNNIRLLAQIKKDITSTPSQKPGVLHYYQ